MEFKYLQVLLLLSDGTIENIVEPLAMMCWIVLVRRELILKGSPCDISRGFAGIKYGVRDMLVIIDLLFIV